VIDIGFAFEKEAAHIRNLIALFLNQVRIMGSASRI
jgi:hypothetical protein